MPDDQKYELRKAALAQFQEQPYYLLKQESTIEEVDEQLQVMEKCFGEMGQAVGRLTEMTALTQASTAVTQQLYHPAAGSLGGGASDQGAD